MNKTPLKQLNFKVPEDFYWELKNTAGKQRCKMVEVLEKAFEFYKKRERGVNEVNVYQQTIQTIEQQMQPLLGSMSLMELETRINFLTSIYFNKIGLNTTYEVLKECLSECLRLEKEKRTQKKFPSLFKKS